MIRNSQDRRSRYVAVCLTLLPRNAQSQNFVDEKVLDNKILLTRTFLTTSNFLLRIAENFMTKHFLGNKLN